MTARRFDARVIERGAPGVWYVDDPGAVADPDALRTEVCFPIADA